MNIAASSYAHIKPSWRQPVQVNRVRCGTLKSVVGNLRLPIGVIVFFLINATSGIEICSKNRCHPEYTLNPFSTFISAACWVDLLPDHEHLTPPNRLNIEQRWNQVMFNTGASASSSLSDL